MLKVYARFQGKHGSLGYSRGKRYHLNFLILSTKQIEIAPQDWHPNAKEQVCVYSNLKTFTDNWKILG